MAQYKGTDPDTSVVMFYKLDVNGAITARYNPLTKTWVNQNWASPFKKPLDLQPALSEQNISEIKTQIDSSGLVKIPTEYIFIGDEPRGPRVMSFRSLMEMGGKSAAQVQSEIDELKKFLQMMPRIQLKGWFEDNFLNKIPGLWFNGVYASVIDLFNEANLEYVKANQLDPWDWEQEKLEAYYVALNKPRAEQLEKEIAAYAENFSNPRAIAIMEAYKALPKLGDAGLEISRQGAIKALLEKKEYDVADGIIAAYQFVKYTVVQDALNEPSPVDIKKLGYETMT